MEQRNRPVDLRQRRRNRVNMRFDNAWHDALACEVDLLRLKSGSLQHFGIRADRAKTLSANRHRLRRGMAGRHRDHRGIVVDDIGRLRERGKNQMAKNPTGDSKRDPIKQRPE
jgi:hypothetical protein